MYKNKKAFTLVEICFAIGMACALIILVLKVSSVIRGDVSKGTVDLQNLQETRLVIDSLRRDFIGAFPLYDTSDDIEIRDEVRASPVLYASSFNKVQNSRPIVLDSHQLNFFKTSMDRFGNPKKEEIFYFFDTTTKTLNRHSSDGEKHFTGMDDVCFNLYYHPLNNEVPMLLVDLTIKTKEGNETKKLKLTTTICSSIVNRDIVNLDWNWASE